MRSEAQIEASRLNGAKSQGPITPEGKARSSKNALKHGLTSTDLCTGVENFETLEARIESYIQIFNPANQLEMDFLVEMAAARHRLHRIWGMETAMLDLEMARQAKDLDTQIPGINGAGRTISAFKSVSNNGSEATLLYRYAVSIRRQFDRAFQNLLQLQRIRGVSHQSVFPNEPNTPLKADQ